MLDHEKLQMVLVLILLTGSGIFCIIASARALFTSRPIILSQRILLYFVVAIFSLIALSLLATSDFVGTVFFLIIGACTLLISPPYIVVGASPDTLREALIASLRKLSIAFEENSAGITIPEKGSRLVVVESPIYGLKMRLKPLAGLWFKRFLINKAQITFLENLVEETKSYFVAMPVKMSLPRRLPFILITFVFGLSCVAPFFMTLAKQHSL